MSSYEQFYALAEEAAKKFSQWDKSQAIRLISHLDADGITASAVILNLLNNENRKHSISILQQLDNETALKLSKENYKYYIFTDLGSGQLSDIAESFKDKEVIVLDHHDPQKTELPANIIHVNPHLFGIDGSKEISGAGVVYMFSCAVNPKTEELAHLAIIGAIGDIQDEGGFLHLNKKILEKAIDKKRIEISKGLRIFGRQTRPLHKVLEYSTDPFIPGVSGSESGAIQFLNELGIDPKKDNDWKNIVDLDEDETQRLVAGIIMKRIDETSPEDVLADIYTLPGEIKGPTRDAKEFATLLNACGRMGRASAGIGLCLGYKKDKQMAMQTLADYKKEIVSAMNWYENNKNKVIKGDKFIIINAKDEIPSTIIGTVASIISKSNVMDKDTYIMSLARTDKKTTKISLRISGTRKGNIDLRDVVMKIVAKAGGEAGGHSYAAGAIISSENEEKFISAAKEILEKI